MKSLPPIGSKLLALGVASVVAVTLLGGQITSLDELPTMQAVPHYERDQFGDGWADLDGDCQDTRDEILIRDLPDEQLDQRQCRVLSGTLHDPYTGRTIDFRRGKGTSGEVHIDHVVPLAYAWRGGAWRWTHEQRVAFANDPDNLLAVDGPANMAKGDAGPSEWLPPDPAAHCDYAARWTEILRRYELEPKLEDAKILRQIHAGCAR